MSSSLPTRLAEHLRATSMFGEPGRALVAVSGGPDSVGLLLLLSDVAVPFGVELVVGHVDHGIHAESADVADRVHALALQLGIECHREPLRLGAGASETRARHARYAALRRMQRTAACRYLVTAHHADDQAETVLLRFLRGSGLDGLAGIPAAGPEGLMRPLLPFRKAEILEWLHQQDAASRFTLEIHEDPSNRDLVHDRSWVRTVLLPTVRARFGERTDAALLDVTANARENRAAWAELLRASPALRFRRCESSVQVARDTLRQYDPRLSTAVLRAAAHELGCVLGPQRARRVWSDLADAQSGKVFELGNGWVLETIFDDLRIRRSGEIGPEMGSESQQWGGSEPGEVRWGEWSIAWTPAEAQAVDRASFITWVTPGIGKVRLAKPGDRIRPLEGRGRRKVSRILMEGRVPWPDRPHYPVLTRGNDVLWVPGICRSERDVPETGKEAIRIDARRN